MSPATSASPMTPNDRFRAPYGRPNPPPRSATTPYFPQTSPDMRPSNLDCAFPPFPTAPKPIPKTREGGYGGLAMADSMLAPVSPRNVSGGGLLQRMNTIAPGPFGVNGRRNTDDNQQHERQKSLKSVARTLDAGFETIRPSTSAGHTRSSSSKGSGSGLPRAPIKDSYGGFGGRASDDGPRPELLRPEDRSQTFPLKNESILPRRPSESTMRTPSPSGQANDSFDRQRKPSVGPDLSRDLPRRGASIYQPRTDSKYSRLAEAPPVPNNVNLAAEFGVGNPYHTPSGSQSSDGSGYSEDSKASSRSSPPSSARSASPRKPSVTTNVDLDVLMSEVQSSMADLRPQEVTSSSPPRENKEQPASELAPARTLGPSFLAPEYLRGPAIQNGRRSPLQAQDSPQLDVFLSPTQLSPKKPAPTRRGTGSKGNCKGCTKPITGKSISSADGRLTGRYHKECFACTTCLEPFKTSTFYVINDAPYCDRHYHKLNGSVCDTCDRGIEGQYLESERKKKFHPKCLTCADCKRTLRHDYFEENGRVYCERDAFRRAQRRQFLGPNSGTSRMERRTTRLMMM